MHRPIIILRPQRIKQDSQQPAHVIGRVLVTFAIGFGWVWLFVNIAEGVK